MLYLWDRMHQELFLCSLLMLTLHRVAVHSVAEVFVEGPRVLGCEAEAEAADKEEDLAFS